MNLRIGLTFLVGVVGFASAASADLNVQGISMQGISMQGISMQGISMQGISMQGISMQGISMQGVNLSGVNMTGIDLTNVPIELQNGWIGFRDAGGNLNFDVAGAILTANVDCSQKDATEVRDMTAVCQVKIRIDSVEPVLKKFSPLLGAGSPEVPGFQGSPGATRPVRFPIETEYAYYHLSYMSMPERHDTVCDAFASSQRKCSVRRVPEVWQPLCPQADYDGFSDRALVVPGSWDDCEGPPAKQGPDSEKAAREWYRLTKKNCGGKRNNTGFAFACHDAGIMSKCIDRFGYRPWRKDMDVMHQACVRMGRADYCGNGKYHTRNGTQIDVEDKNEAPQKFVTDGDPEWRLDARWDEHGATCFGVARWDWTAPRILGGREMIDELRDECGIREVQKPSNEACTPVTPKGIDLFRKQGVYLMRDRSVEHDGGNIDIRKLGVTRAINAADVAPKPTAPKPAPPKP